VSFLTTAIGFVLTTVVWCGSAALVALPLYVNALPHDAARFGLFTVTSGGGAVIAGLIGLVGLALVAPWTTVGVATAEAEMAKWLLGPAPSRELARRVDRLEASRTAALDSAEAERRRIERDLHDGAQQRLVALAMDLGQASERFDTDLDTAKELVVGAHEEAKAALADLRQLVRGSTPRSWRTAGSTPRSRPSWRNSPVPVTLNVDVPERPAPVIESTAYFMVSEALANVAKHAKATKASVTIARRGDRLAVEVTDDGAGGADPAGGTGLRGLAERVAAADGWMRGAQPAGRADDGARGAPCGS
jgi:signal transduction histidine kinase